MTWRVTEDATNVNSKALTFGITSNNNCTVLCLDTKRPFWCSNEKTDESHTALTLLCIS